MRIILFITSAIITTGLIIVLHTNLVLPAALGKLLSPQHGIWQNAESDYENFSANIVLNYYRRKPTINL